MYEIYYFEFQEKRGKNNDLVKLHASYRSEMNL